MVNLKESCDKTKVENYNTKVGVSFFGGLDTDTGTAYHAKAEAIINDGRITQINVTDPGQGYISAPLVYITPDPLEGGKPDKEIPEDDFENFREYDTLLMDLTL